MVPHGALVRYGQHSSTMFTDLPNVACVLLDLQLPVPIALPEISLDGAKPGAVAVRRLIVPAATNNTSFYFA